MEVVVSAAVLILVVLGSMAAIDSVTGTAGANKARTVAATLAEKDQEELRSLKTADLNQLPTLIPAPRTVTVDGVPYTVTSEARVVTDGTGEDISCALESGQGIYVRITSTVTSPMTGANDEPVRISSIVAPEPGSGTLVAMVRNAKDNPVVNMPVEANGPDIKTVKTNDAGCAVFGTMEAGAYELRVNQGGWVDPDGNQEVVKTATVAAGTLTTVEFLYDLGAILDVTVETIVPATPSGTTRQTDASHGIVAAHNGISTTYRWFTGPDTDPPSFPPSTYTLTGLYPFDDDEYTIFSGRCEEADPIAQADYYATVEGWGPLTDATPALAPGERRAVTIFEAAVNLNATWSSTGAINSSTSLPAYAYAYPKIAGCGPARIYLGTLTNGKAARPGVPFGTYDICIERRNGSRSTDWYKRVLTNLPVNHLLGTPVQSMNIPNTTGARGQCGQTTP